MILTWLSSSYHCCGAQKDMTVGHVGDRLFCKDEKPISPCHVGDTVFFARAKIPYQHIWSTRWSCLWLCIRYQIGKLVRKKKCMVNSLWYGNFHIIPHISPGASFGPRADMGVSGWYGVWYENCRIIISIYQMESAAKGDNLIIKYTGSFMELWIL